VTAGRTGTTVITATGGVTSGATTAATGIEMIVVARRSVSRKAAATTRAEAGRYLPDAGTPRVQPTANDLLMAVRITRAAISV
jgi:hypothetical protein